MRENQLVLGEIPEIGTATFNPAQPSLFTTTEEEGRSKAAWQGAQSRPPSPSCSAPANVCAGCAQLPAAFTRSRSHCSQPEARGGSRAGLGGDGGWWQPPAPVLGMCTAAPAALRGRIPAWMLLNYLVRLNERRHGMDGGTPAVVVHPVVHLVVHPVVRPAWCWLQQAFASCAPIASRTSSACAAPQQRHLRLLQMRWYF